MRFLENFIRDFNFDLMSDKLENFENRRKYSNIIYCIYADYDEEFAKIYSDFEKNKQNFKNQPMKIVLCTSKGNISSWISKFYAESEIINLSDMTRSLKSMRKVIEESFKASPLIKSPKIAHKYIKIEKNLIEDIILIDKFQ
jgi:hypothetical protein